MSKLNSRFITSTRPGGYGKNKNDLSVILLSSQYIPKMKSLGPKSNLYLKNGETVLQHQVSSITTAFPKAEILLTVGFEADKAIKNCLPNIRVIENQLWESTNIAEDARLALNNCTNENVLLICGDLLFNYQTIDRITKDGCSTILVDMKNQIPENEVGVTIINERVSIFSYGISPRWAQSVFLCNKELKFFKNIVADRERNKMYIFEILNMIIDKRGSFKTSAPEQMEVRKILTAQDL